MSLKGVDLIDLAQYREKWRGRGAFVGREIKLQVSQNAWKSLTS
jgi:hypothetical protein